MPKDKRHWATVEQCCWLSTTFDEYAEAQAQGHFTKFWPKLFEDWFRCFPARAPGPEDATDSEPDSDSDVPSESESENEATRATSKRKRGKAKTKPRKSAKTVSGLISAYESVSLSMLVGGSSAGFDRETKTGKKTWSNYREYEKGALILFARVQFLS